MRLRAGDAIDRVGWVRRVLGRRLADGRFPPETTSLLRDVPVGLARRYMQRVVAGALPAHGASVGGPRGRVLPGEWRRWVLGPEVPAPASELPHLVADQVISRLRAVELHPFLVEERLDGTLHFGLSVDERGRALDALNDLAQRDGWYLEAYRGHRRRILAMCGRAHRRAARRAASWNVFRLYQVGDAAIGRHQGLLVTFWAPGPNDRMEQVGIRGLQRFDRAAVGTVEHVNGRAYPGLESFPVERELTSFREPVDVVVTWVDGDDPNWRRAFDEWRGKESFSDSFEQLATHQGRFTSHDELRYMLRSLWLYAGWVRRIYIVTADQQPEWLVANDTLRVVSHREIIPPDCLPTFNSHAIEARLHHIEGLAEHFIYFNDDVFLARPLGPCHFFTPNGLAKFFESDARIPVASSTEISGFADTAARRGRTLIERNFGVLVAKKLHHAPFALRREVLFEIDENFPDTVERTVRQRFRHPDDLSIASGFANHYAFMTGRAICGALDVVYQNLGGRRLGVALRRLELTRDADVLCINETERWETDQARATQSARAFLERYYPVASPWEKT
jgi:hypothetical protein